MNKINIQRREGANEERSWEIVILNENASELMRSRKTLTKAEASRIAKTLRHEGGRSGSVAIATEGEGYAKWVEEDEGWKLNIINETTFDVLIEKLGLGGDILEEIKGIFLEETEIRWVPEEEDPNRNNPTPTKGLPGS